MSLVLCGSCSRHLRSTELVCPFCGVGLEVKSSADASMPWGSTRAQIFLGALTLAAATSAAACNKPDPGPNDPTSIVAPYGAPMPTDLPSSATGEAYGAPPPPPVDAGAPKDLPKDAGPGAKDAGALRPPSPAGAYGAPPKPG